MSTCMIVAEIGQTHEGSLGNALAFIDAVAETGADAVKFQCHDGDPNYVFRAGCWVPQDKTRKAYWKRTGFSGRHWQQLRQRASSRGLQFGISVFSHLGMGFMSQFDCDFLKVPCGHADRLIYRLNRELQLPLHDKPRYVSWDYRLAGGGTAGETETMIHCTPEYPTKIERVGADMVGQEDCEGLSSHCPDIGPSIEAAKRGAIYLEHHVCWDRRQFGPDVSSSITIDELAELVKAVRAI